MSFSSDVKRELVGRVGETESDKLAELAAILENSAKIRLNPPAIRIQAENYTVVDKADRLIRDIFGLSLDVRARWGMAGSHMRSYEGVLCDWTGTQAILSAVGFWREEDGLYRYEVAPLPELLQSTEGKRAYLRGAFLGSASISDPNKKNNHLEFTSPNLRYIERLAELMKHFGIRAGQLTRSRTGARDSEVLYLKNGDQISELLILLGASNAMMSMENIRIYRELNNQVHRRVNCETANINKSVAAAEKSKEDILFLKKHHYLELLPEPLREMARVRLEQENIVSLARLGECMDPPLGKSGVNHRLRKLSEEAEYYRKKELEK